MKVGGKRVPLPKHTHEEKAEPAAVEEAADIANLEKANANKTVLVSGAAVKEKDAYTTEAVKHMHEKQMPTHGHSASHSHNINNIQQPRKN